MSKPKDGPHRLDKNWIHLGLGACSEPQEPYTDMSWYADYAARTASDGAEGRLVSQHSFTQDWPHWEMHPKGSEVVICIKGAMMLTQEFPDGRVETAALEAGDYAINPPGVWHIADIADQATAIFITAGQDTQHRAR